MRNLLLLLFVTSIFQVNAQSYKIEQEIDVNGALDITNMNSVYNQMGVHYVGNGYYASTSSNTGFGTKNSAISQANNYVSEVDRSINFSVGMSNGQINGNYIKVGGGETFYKFIFQLVIKGYNVSFPYLSRSEAISRAKENNDLFELGLISKQKFDNDLFFIRKILDSQ